MRVNNMGNSYRTSVCLLRLAAMATVNCIVVSLMTGCGNTQDKVGVVSPTFYQPIEVAPATHSLAVGQPAPFFALPNQEGKTVSSANLKGSWIVLHFFPEGNTPECIREATEFTDRLSAFRKMNARVFGVNTDSVESHLNYRDKYGLELDLLSDPEGKMMRQYGACVEPLLRNTHSTRTIRSTFLMNQNGCIAYHWPQVRPRGHAERVKDKLAQLQHGATVNCLENEFDILIVPALFSLFY